MQYKILIIFFLLSSCVQNFENINIKTKALYSSKGFAYIYNDEDFNNKLIKRKLDNNLLQVAHHKLKPGTLIKLINLKTNDSIVLKNTKRIDFPEFYKILITKPVADKLNLKTDLPLVEVFEVKKNKSFIAKKTKIFKEEEKIHNNAPVENVTIANISKTNKDKKSNVKEKFFIVIADFYSKESALFLKKRITNELINYDSKKLYIKTKKMNIITLLSGPYSSINLMKNDYILLKNFGFEELDISINE